MECRVSGHAAPSEKPNRTVYEVFCEAWVIYKEMGMSWEEFWERDCSLILYYRKRYKKRQKERFEQENFNAWLQGRYFYDALCATSPLFHDLAKKGTTARPYWEKPIEFVSSKAELEDKTIRQLEAYFGNLNARYKASEKAKGKEGENGGRVKH